MPNKNTPAKHKTPNYHQRANIRKWWDAKRNAYIVDTQFTWEPEPLRASRKDHNIN